MSSTNDPRDIVSTRVLDATRDVVFRAFADPSRCARWWGPKDFTSTFHAFDMKPGGTWRFTMHAPDGKSFELVKRFVDVVENERVVYYNEQAGHGFTMTMTFVAVPASASRTLLTWHMRFDDEHEAARSRAVIVDANEQNFDRLAAHLRAAHA